LSIHLRQFSQQFLSSLVVNVGSLDHDFDDFVAARILARVHDALLPQPELLEILSSLRDLQQRASVDGWDLDLCPQPRLRNRDGHLNVNIVALASEERMRLDPYCDVQISSRCTTAASIALSRDAQA